MSDVMPFRSPVDDREIRTFVVDGEPWFVAGDIAAALGYANPSAALSDHVDDEDRALSGPESPMSEFSTRPQRLAIVNESGLYALIFGSRLPAAKTFKRWITSEVLPSLRRTGSYLLESRDDLDVVQGMLDAIRADRKRLAIIEQRQDTSDDRVHVIESKLSDALGEYDEFTALGFAKLNGLSTDRSFLIRLGRKASDLMKIAGDEPRKRQDVSFGRINVYPVQYLRAALAELS